MTRGIAFMKWTDQGARTSQETVDRLEPTLKLAGKFGCEIKEVFWTPGGPYDLIGIAEAPDSKSLTSYCLALQTWGNLRLTWTEAYGPDEMREVLASGG